MKKFVLLASMRTGSNLLNSLLNQYKGVAMHGEVFNPKFIGLKKEYHEKLNIKRDKTLNLNLNIDFLEKLYNNTSIEKGVHAVGFHLFPGHSNKILEYVCERKDIIKIGLRRSYFPSYISLLEANKSQVWLMTGPNQKHGKGKVQFNPTEFLKWKKELNVFWHYINKNVSNSELYNTYYSQIKKVETTNEIISLLGLKEKKEKLEIKLVKQTNLKLSDRVENYNELLTFANENGLSHHLE